MIENCKFGRFLVFDRTNIFTEPPNRTEPEIFLPNRTVPNRTRHLPQILILLKNITFSAFSLVVEAHFYTHIQSMTKSTSKATFCEINHFSKKIWRFLNLHETLFSSILTIVCPKVSSKMTFGFEFMLLFLVFLLFGSVYGSVHRTTGSAEPPNLTEPVVLPNYRTEPESSVDH